ncbi:MAG: COQ9 family protein [Alphaproteobacteria bacterium]|nr:COQ9 family protein [Alphaproteobacteria bacterium]
MTEKTETTAPSDEFRERLLDAMLLQAAEKGWTKAAFDAAATESGLSAGQAMLAAPGGVADLLEALAQRAAGAAAARLAAPDIRAMKVREKVAAGVRAYLAALEQAKPAVRRAAGSPVNLLTGPKGVWIAADAIWSALGDKSTDFNWYTKRMILSGVIGSTLLVWLGTDGAGDVDAFLARRIQNVMDFETAKGRAREFASKLPDPLDLLGRKTPPSA